MSQYETQVSASIPKIRVKGRTRPNFFPLPSSLPISLLEEGAQKSLSLPTSFTHTSTHPRSLRRARLHSWVWLERERFRSFPGTAAADQTLRTLSGWSRPAQSRLSSEDETQILWLQDPSPE